MGKKERKKKKKVYFPGDTKCIDVKIQSRQTCIHVVYLGKKEKKKTHGK